MTSRPSTAAPILAVLAIVLVMLGAYVVVYLSLLVIEYPNRYVVNEATGQMVMFGSRRTTANYWLGGDTAKMLFRPLETIDRRLRPGTWDPLFLMKSQGVVAPTVQSPNVRQEETVSDGSLPPTDEKTRQLMKALSS
jgi:hypothetical protein